MILKRVRRRISAGPSPAHVVASAPRLVIEQVQPSLDEGRHAVKRVVGDVVAVEATVYREGHDLIAARVRYRAPGGRSWRTSPMTYERDLDRVRGSFRLDAIGRWLFTVEAWTDRFATWRTDLFNRARVEMQTHGDLLEGAGHIAEAVANTRNHASKASLEHALALLRDEKRSVAERTDIALDARLFLLMDAHLPPSDLTRHPVEFPLVVDPPDAAFAAWYELFPRSQAREPGRHGTFADAAERLPALADLGFDVVYLPPIHPIGRTARKGRNNALRAGRDDPGSPWAIGNEHGGHTAIEPRLGTLEDFRAFVKRAHSLGLEVALDYALQCSPDHPWLQQHPDWFFHRPDGSIRHAENPPKKYQDIVPLNFWNADAAALWKECRDVLLYWIEQGVRTFRVDNPHTKPYAFWEWCIADIKRRHPATVFLSEAFTRPARMKGLARLGFTQSYTYFTWRNNAWELREYLTELTRDPVAQYMRPNLFANTPDILHEYLQTGGRAAFLVRLILAGTLSPLYGIYSGFELCEDVPARRGSEEYMHSEKYELRVRDWNADGNINAEIRTLNRIRRAHPALQRLDNLDFHPSENEAILFYHKTAVDDDLLVAVNLDPHNAQETMVHVPLDALGIAHDVVYEVDDLLSGVRYRWQGVRNYVRLDPAAQVAHILHVRRPGTP